jgi:hypothetical protein
MSAPREQSNVELIRSAFEKLRGRLGDRAHADRRERGALPAADVSRDRRDRRLLQGNVRSDPGLANGAHRDRGERRGRAAALAQGRHAGGSIADITASGRPLAIDGMEHFVIRAGKLVSSFAVTDQVQFARQVGMMPADGSGPDRAMKKLFRVRTKLARRLKR